jgi:uncharacterized caspase-like protein
MGMLPMRRVGVAFLLLMILAATSAHAEKRVALVIGNSAYLHAAELINPKHDADDMAAALKALGIEVIKGLDLDKRGMEREVRKFSTALNSADVGIFFYSGHGLQVNGNNYLVPVDAELSTADALEFEMVRLDLIQRIMEGNAKTNILFLDACRNNPLSRNLARAMGTRSGAIGKGLAPAESGVGTLISFSTQPGNVALDGAGRNSPYTGPLVKRIGKAGEDVLSVLTEVRNEVLAATGEKQVPWENHALRARFYFSTPPVVAPVQPPAPARMSDAAEAWGAVKDGTNVGALEAFISRFKDTFYAELARLRIEELKRQQISAASPPKQQTPPSAAKPAANVAPSPAIVPPFARFTDGVIKIGVLNDLSSIYASASGAGSLWAARKAVTDFCNGIRCFDKIEVISADHQNKPEVGSRIAAHWYEVDKVDVIVDVPLSSVALAINDITKVALIQACRLVALLRHGRSAFELLFVGVKQAATPSDSTA